MAAGDITYTHACDAGVSAIATGLVSADADTAINVIVGFVPSRIEIFYEDISDGSLDMTVLWFSGLPAGDYLKTLHSDGVVTHETSGGPLLYGDTGDDVWGSEDNNTNGQGFTISAAMQDADVDQMYYQAFR